MAIQSGATHVGRIASIITGAVRDVAGEFGEFATDVFEMREASRRAEADRERAEDLVDPESFSVSADGE